MRVHPRAVAAYRDYLKEKEVPHVFHPHKNFALLDLLQSPATAEMGEQCLCMLARSISSMGASLRSPKPLARYLATQPPPPDRAASPTPALIPGGRHGDAACPGDARLRQGGIQAGQ